MMVVIGLHVTRPCAGDGQGNQQGRGKVLKHSHSFLLPESFVTPVPKSWCYALNRSDARVDVLVARNLMYLQRQANNKLSKILKSI